MNGNNIFTYATPLWFDKLTTNGFILTSPRTALY